MMVTRHRVEGGDNVIARDGERAMPGGKRRRRLEAELGAGQMIGRRRVVGLLAGVAAAGVLGFSNQARAASTGKRIVNEAMKHRGERYVAGGTSPREGFDCSGFTYYVVNKAIGKDITPALQTQVKQAGKRVGKNSRRTGDLIFFNLEGGRRVTHVAISLGKSKVIHAMNPELDVRTSDISDTSYWKVHSVRRL